MQFLKHSNIEVLHSLVNLKGNSLEYEVSCLVFWYYIIACTILPFGHEDSINSLSVSGV